MHINPKFRATGFACTHRDTCLLDINFQSECNSLEKLNHAMNANDGIIRRKHCSIEIREQVY